MRSVLISFIVAIMLCGSAMAIGHPGDATYDPDMDVHKTSWWERLTDKFEIGTYNDAGSFTTNFYQYDSVTAKFDETSYNAECGAAKFVVEIYSPSGFEDARYYWVGPVKGSQHFSGTVRYGAGDELGTWSFVDYLYCVDESSDQYLKVISTASKIDVTVLSKSAGQTCDAGWLGTSFCSNGDAKRTYRNTDCSSDLRTVEACKGDRFCFDGKCVDPECSMASDCEPWQECLRGECVATDESIKRYQDSLKDDDEARSDEGGGPEGGGSSGGDVEGGTDGDSQDDDSKKTWFMVAGGLMALGAVLAFTPFIVLSLPLVAVGALIMIGLLVGII